LFGAVCSEHGTGAALVLPACNSEAMQLHLDEIATKVTRVHARSSSSIKPDGMAPKPSRSQATSRCCHCRRAHHYAWNTLIDQPWKMMSVARRDWATIGHSI
jgi:hypothetical protein